MAEQLTGRQQVIARIEVARRLGKKYLAEAAGLEDSLVKGLNPGFLPDPEDRESYAMGFNEGREILKAHGTTEPEVA